MGNINEPSFEGVMEEGMKVLSADDTKTAAEAMIMKAAADQLARAWKPFNRAFLWKDFSESMKDFL
jgi:hypothetical protein